MSLRRRGFVSSSKMERGKGQFQLLHGFLLIALFPFTRLVHLVALPFWYPWRPYQVVIRNRRTGG